METLQERYSSLARLASYLDAEWSDILVAGQRKTWHDLKEIPSIHPSREMNPRFYFAVLEQLKGIATDGPLRYADIGAGTGRLMYEWMIAFPSTEDAVYCEPADLFAEWGENLLKGKRQEWIPAVHERDRPTFLRPADWPSELSPMRVLTIWRGRAHTVPRPESYFDVVSSLNVIDRVDQPAKYVGDVARMVRPGGHLVLSTPFDWKTEYTPRERWIEDIQAISPAGWELLRNIDIEYDIRATRRDAERYISQVVVLRKPHDALVPSR